MTDPALLVFAPLAGRLWRIVEHQEQAATRAVTGSAREQSRLEELLESQKPAWLPGSEALHWLLKTPFRYPPLRYGSRFGSADGPGILYGSERRETAMTEAATYLWLFRAGPADTGALEVIRDGRTALRFAFRTDSGADLSRDEVAHHRARLCDPGSWTDSQALGDALRVAGAELIRYPSARHAGGISSAVLSPAAVAAARQPLQEHWQFRLDGERCWWGRGDGLAYEVHYRDLADESGRIPHPAL